MPSFSSQVTFTGPGTSMRLLGRDTAPSIIRVRKEVLAVSSSHCQDPGRRTFCAVSWLWFAAVAVFLFILTFKGRPSGVPEQGKSSPVRLGAVEGSGFCPLPIPARHMDWRSGLGSVPPPHPSQALWTGSQASSVGQTPLGREPADLSGLLPSLTFWHLCSFFMTSSLMKL